MLYVKPLPRIDNIVWLKMLSRPFPTTAGAILSIAKKWNFSKSTLDFLRLFPADEVFASGDDLLTRAEEVEMLMREERKMPAETLYGSED